MDKHGIGTDASIPQHIQTIQDRHYVQLTDGDGQAILPQSLATWESCTQDEHQDGSW